MTEHGSNSDFDPTQIPRPTGIDHLGRKIDPADSAQPNPHYVYDPGVHGMEDLPERMEAADLKRRRAEERLRAIPPVDNISTKRLTLFEVGCD